MKETPVSKAAEKKVKDKITGTYNGKKVFTGPRGGKYYINKNGNKTYIDRDAEE
jgi:colicin import membrane protein